MKTNHTSKRIRLQQQIAYAYMRGQSSVEYLVICIFAIIVLIEGGRSAPVQMLIQAFKDVWSGFGYAISYATTLTAL